MLASQSSAEWILTDNFDFVRDECRAVSNSIDKNSAITFSFCNCQRCRIDKIREIASLFVVSSKILNFMPLRFQPCFDLEFIAIFTKIPPRNIFRKKFELSENFPAEQKIESRSFSINSRFSHRSNFLHESKFQILKVPIVTRISVASFARDWDAAAIS